MDANTSISSSASPEESIAVTAPTGLGSVELACPQLATTTKDIPTAGTKKVVKKNPPTLSPGNVISIDFHNRRKQIYKIHSHAGKTTASLAQAKICTTLLARFIAST